jgi:signal transduction histidine kinase
MKISVRIDSTTIDSAHELAIYQIAKEALANALRHSQARNIDVSLTQEDAITVSVADDGVGFDPLVARASHYGLQIMRDRAKTIGGTLFVDSLPGGGCRVTLSLPREGNSS